MLKRKRTPGWLVMLWLLLIQGGAMFGSEELLVNGGFENRDQGWKKICHFRPGGTVETSSDEAHSGDYSLFFKNTTGVREHYYELFSQRLEKLEPGATYILAFWGKGEISGKNRFGVCDDAYGNKGTVYAEVGSSDEWMRYEIRFKPDENGQKNIILMSRDLIEGFYIDDLSVTEE